MPTLRLTGDTRRLAHQMELAVREGMRKATVYVAGAWVRLAQQRVRKGLASYTAGITTRVTLQPPKGEVYLQTKLSRLLEGGWPPFDMRPGLLARGTKVGRGGFRYRRVPVGGGKVRTITDLSLGWQHPGFKGHRLRGDVIKLSLPQVRRVIGEEVARALGGRYKG